MSLVSGVNGAINGNMTNPKKTKVASELEQFDDIFPELVESLTKIGLKDNQICDAVSWFKEVGPRIRGICISLGFDCTSSCLQGKDNRGKDNRSCRRWDLYSVVLRDCWIYCRW